VGRIVFENGDVIKEVKKVTDTHDGFLRIEYFVKSDMTDSKKLKVVTEVLRKDSIRKIEGVKIWESKSSS
jgi:hypothetical protein